jgi:ABC-2 type transport system permease protein
VIKLLNLVLNENMKIYRRMRTWILVALLIGLCFAVSFINRYESMSSGNKNADWRAKIQEQAKSEQQQLNDENLPKAARDSIENNLKVHRYQLEHNIPPEEATLWGGVAHAAGLVSLVTLFTVIIAADAVAAEFTWGTIKLLLIRPASRAKILLSKYISTLMFALLLLVVLFVSALAINGFFYGFEHVAMPSLKVGADGLVKEGSLLVDTVSIYALKVVELVMIVTLAFMISTVFRSSSLAIGLSIFIMFTGNVLTIFLLRYSWGKYFLFANTDLTQYIVGRPLAEGMTMGFSVAVLAVYFLVFNALSWGIFTKRDVAA